MGNGLDNILIGNDANNSLTGGAGNDTIDGGGGTDTLNFIGALSGHSFSINASNEFTVTDTDLTNGNNGTDTFANIEFAKFASGTVSLRAYGETRINTSTDNYQFSPAIATLIDGDYVVAWESYLQDGSGYGIFAKRYDSAGNVLGNETRINTTTALDQGSPCGLQR